MFIPVLIFTANKRSKLSSTPYKLTRINVCQTISALSIDNRIILILPRHNICIGI